MRWGARQTILACGWGVFGLGMGLFAWLGVFNRYWADDWCYNADFKDLGLLGTLQGYSYITTYASNRYSLTLFGGLLYKLGVPGLQIMTPLAIGLCLVGVLWTLSNMGRLNLASGMAAMAMVYFSLYLAPHLYQSIYWRSGLLPYTAPLMMSLLLLGWITWPRQKAWVGRSGARPAAALSAAVLAFLAGGFSEAGCAYLITLLTIVTLACLWGVYRQQPWAATALPLSLLALFGALVAMIVLATAPTSAIRAARYGDPAAWQALPGLTLFYSLDFIRLSLLDFPLPHLAFVLTCGLLGFLQALQGGEATHPRRLLGWALLAALGTLLLVAASYAPSAYIEQAPPALRARIIPRFVLLAGLGWGAWLFGELAWGLAQVWSAKRPFIHRWLEVSALVLLLVGLVYAGRSVVITGQKAALYRQRAIVWDRRDQLIRQSLEMGILDVNVPAIDGQPVGGIRDLKEQETNWVNNCAERYYGVQALRAGEP